MSGLRLGRFTTTQPILRETASEQPCQVHDTPVSAGTDEPKRRMSQTSVSPRPPVVVITGGPCGGKSTLLERISQPGCLGDVRVIPVREIATQLMLPDLARPSDMTHAHLCRVEGGMVDAQCALENFACSIPSLGARAVVVCDRGAVDAAAYCEPAIWQHVLADLDTTESQLYQRYDFVLHVTSVAVDAPELYHSDNNAARFEACDEAAALDGATADAWARHPNRQVLGNDFPSFEAKMAEGERRIARFVAFAGFGARHPQEPPRAAHSSASSSLVSV